MSETGIKKNNQDQAGDDQYYEWRDGKMKNNVYFKNVLIAGIMTALFTTVCYADDKANQLTDIEKLTGWTSLFDGKSTEHWRGYKQIGFPEKGWRVDGDAIQVMKGGGGGDIITQKQYENFELVLEWKVSEKANSGIMYRVTEEGNSTWNTGPEYQILDDQGHNFDKTNMHSAGALYALAPPRSAKISKPAGEWNTARIILNNGNIQHFLNGVKVVEDDFNSADWKSRVAASKFKGYEGFSIRKQGHIALQDHGNDVWFRNIKIRDLDGLAKNETVLFNGKDLNGWTTYFRDGATSDDTWVIQDGILICKGQPIGYVRTTKKHTNYILRLQWRFNPITKQEGNSGVLLRMIGEDKVWPKSVEAQLHSGNAGDFWNIDNFEMKVDESRTRGRNTKKTHHAENPVGEWNNYEIVVNEGDVTLMVNGQILNNAWDVAEVAGYICLQSEGAEIHFRNIRMVDLDKRAHSAVTPEERSGWHRNRFLKMNERVSQGNVDLIFIGDSITQAWEGGGKDVWRKFYGNRNAVNLGISGDRTQHVLWRLQNGNIEGINPKAAVIMIGTNNSNGKDNTASEIADGVTAIVELLRAELPDMKILLLDIFPRGTQVNNQRGKILQANQIIAKLHDGEHVFFQPIGQHFINSDGSISKNIMPDYLHLTTAGYLIWANAIENKLAIILGE